MHKPSSILFSALLLSALTAIGAGNVKEPIYIGAQACAQCHDGPAMGHQFSKWRLSAHAAAYASLALPEAKTIAEFSGIPEQPYQARMCLGCHSTASETEDWERTEGFHLEDGLQCEGCHGPGSEYASAEIMKDRAKAMANGLRMPNKDSCMLCHRTKGSHDMALKRTPFNLEMAWEAISHATPRAGQSQPKTVATSAAASHKFVGVLACAKCHGDAQHGFQFSKWRMSKHAQAFAVLASPRAAELARDAGVNGDPQNCGQCLKCHATGSGSDRACFLKDFDVHDGVQCESLPRTGGRLLAGGRDAR